MPGAEGPAQSQPSSAQPQPSSAQPPSTADSPARPAPPPPDELGVDTAFTPAALAQLASYGGSGHAAPFCMWCNAPLPSASEPRCPQCGAHLEPVDGARDVPGLTSMPPRGGSATQPPPWPAASQTASPAGSLAPRTQVPSTAARPSPYEGLTPEEMALLADSSLVLREEISRLNPRDAYEPPSRDVRQAMLEIEFEADRADPMRIVDPGPLAERRRNEEPPV
jgi:hypothetical protein